MVVKFTMRLIVEAYDVGARTHRRTPEETATVSFVFLSSMWAKSALVELRLDHRFVAHLD